MVERLLDLLLLGAKTIGLFVLALAAFRLMGKRTLGDMEPIDFVVVLAIAEIVGAPLADPDLSIWPAVIAVTVLTLIQLGLALLSIGHPRLSTVLEGKPITVIKEGRVLANNLKRARVTPAELAERLRERGFIGPDDVELAIFETDGMLSAIPRREAAPITPRFLGLKPSTVLLLQGKPVTDNLVKSGLDENDLERALGKLGLGLADAEEVIIDPKGRLHVSVRLDAERSGPGSGTAAKNGTAARKGRGGKKSGRRETEG